MKALRKLQHFKIYPAEELSNVLNILSIMCLSTHIFEEFTEFSVDNRTLNFKNVVTVLYLNAIEAQMERRFKENIRF